jgi:hypothetical protein
MDSDRFDALTRRLAAGVSRRSMLTGLGGALGLLGLKAQSGEARRRCTGIGDVCTGTEQCCLGLVCAPNGTCQDARGLIQSLNIPSAGGLLGGGLPGSGSCPAGADSCSSSGSVSCGGVCQCFRTPEGTSACVNAQSLSCKSRGCASSSDCPAGQACIAPFGDSCGCFPNNWICGPLC